MVVSETCNTAKREYISAKITMTNKTNAYEPCAETDATYPAVDERLQPVPDPRTQRTNTLTPIIDAINNQNTTYTALVTSIKALISAMQPLTDYKTILQNQLASTSTNNAVIQKQIASNANSTMISMAATPDLSKGGPFGTSNVQQGVLWGFLSFYSFFFILLSAVIYLKLKNSVSMSLLIIGILILLAGAGAGAYFCAAYSLFLFDVQSFVTTIKV